LDGQPTHDRAQRAGEHLARELLDLVLLVEEPLPRGPDRVGGTADLDDRHALQVAADALLAHRALDLDVDAAAGQAEAPQPLDDRAHEHRGAHDHLLAGQVVASHAVHALDGPALASGHDERLVGAGHLDPAHDVQDYQDQQYRAADQDDDHVTHSSSFRLTEVVCSTTTLVSLGAATTKTWAPSGTGRSARALSFTGWPPSMTRTSPYPRSVIAVTTTPSRPIRSWRVGVASVR